MGEGNISQLFLAPFQGRDFCILGKCHSFLIPEGMKRDKDPRGRLKHPVGARKKNLSLFPLDSWTGFVQ